MSLVQACTPHLPYLRRFARSLTGTQSSGDAYVRAALAALAAGEADFDETIPAKMALYKMFLGIWSSSGALLEDNDVEGDKPSDRIIRLAPKSRQAFLLNALEGFTAAQIATVMGVSYDAAQGLIDEAEAEIEKELCTNVLIIEDEPIIAADIEGLVEDLGHTVDGIAATRDQAVKLAKDKKPGIVLSDIQLADGSSGIDAVADILKDYDVPVIFITAYPERLLTGERPEPAYLITKPFGPKNVMAAISQALFFHNA